MTSNRPTPSQRSLEFDPDAGEPREVPEPQRGQSVSAAMKTTTLGPVSENLMEQIVDERNMERAWKKVKANRGAPGPDGVTLDEFFRTFRDQWPIVRQQLLDGTYEPDPARRKSIPLCLLFWGVMAASGCWAFPMSKKDCFSKPSYKS